MTHTYELTVEVANRDWHSIRVQADDYHDAAVQGLDYAFDEKGRLIRIEKIVVLTGDKGTMSHVQIQ